MHIRAKNIPALFCLGACVFLGLPNAAPCLSLSLSGVAYQRYARLSEYVFIEDGGKLSELDWDESPALCFGGRLDVSARDWNVFLSAAGCVPDRCGSMADSDWLAADGVKNVYSVHYGSVMSGLTVEAGTGWTADLSPRLRLTPSFSVSYERVSLRAENGRGWYGDAAHSSTGEDVPYDSSAAAYLPQGSLYGVDYTRSAIAVWTGAALEIALPPFTVRIGAGAAPLTYIKAVDHHHDGEGGVYYLDRIFGVFASGRVGISVSVPFSEHLAFGAGFLMTGTRDVRGRTYVSYSEDGPYTRQDGYESGAGGHSADIALTVRFGL